MYTLKDYNEKIGWGHSNNVSSAIFAIAAKVKNLVLFHHEPNYSDKKISKILTDTRKLISGMGGDLKCFTAKELQEINF